MCYSNIIMTILSVPVMFMIPMLLLCMFVFVRSRIKLAFQTHYVGDLRSVTFASVCIVITD